MRPGGYTEDVFVQSNQFRHRNKAVSRGEVRHVDIPFPDDTNSQIRLVDIGPMSRRKRQQGVDIERMPIQHSLISVN